MAKKEFRIVAVDQTNVEEQGFFCITNKKHPGYSAKLDWLKQRFKQGLRLKLLKTNDDKTAGFLEYVPSDFTWRVIEATDYLVIHCLWVASNKFPYRGMASALLQNCYEDAKRSGLKGVAVVTSDGPWMAGDGIYKKNGFKLCDTTLPHFRLLARTKRTTGGNTSKPSFPTDWSTRLKRCRGLQLLYSNQCPYIGKAVKELPLVAKAHGIQLKLTEFKDPQIARQRMPSPYGTVCLVYKNRILADHPISATRFRNILQKDLGLSET